MDSAAISWSLNCALRPVPPAKSFLKNPAVTLFCRASSKRSLVFQVPVDCQRLICSSTSRKGSLLAYVKASKTTSALTSDADTVESTPEGLPQQKNVQKSTFPNGVETLVLDVCDKTDVAELKLKVGDFEMHLKRNIGTPKASAPVASAVSSFAIPPPAPSKPNVESVPSPKTVPQKSTNPFANVSSAKTSKLAALEASGCTYVVVSSPTVGLFRSGRTLKKKRLPPSCKEVVMLRHCKEGDVIKEGQIIGFVDRFGSELPVRSDKAGEVLKILFKDGEPIGYGDPLIAVLPSFPGIK